MNIVACKNATIIPTMRVFVLNIFRFIIDRLQKFLDLFQIWPIESR